MAAPRAMTHLLVLALAASPFLANADRNKCKATYDGALAKAAQPTDKCAAYLVWTACDEQAAGNDVDRAAMQQQHDDALTALYTVKEHAAYQACVASIKAGTTNDAPQVRTARGDLEFTVGGTAEVNFVRTKRETVSLWDLNSQVQKLKGDTEGLTGTVGKTLDDLEVRTKATLDGVVATVGAITDKATDNSKAAALAALKDVQTTLTQAVTGMKKDVAGAKAEVAKSLADVAEKRKAELKEIDGFKASLKKSDALAAAVKKCEDQGMIWNGKACILAKGTVTKHPSETMVVTCDKAYSVDGVCVMAKDNRKNDVTYSQAADYCLSKEFSRMCTSAEVGHMCAKGKFKDKKVRHFVWVRAAEGGDNHEGQGVYVKSSSCSNDDFNRNDGSGMALCCRDMNINIGCKEGLKSGVHKGNTAVRWKGNKDEQVTGCIGYEESGRRKPMDSLALCQSKGQRWGTSAETQIAYYNGRRCKTGMCWFDGGEGNDNQEYNGRNQNGYLDDWNRNYAGGTQCYVNFLPPIKRSECHAKGGMPAGSTCLTYSSIKANFYYYHAAQTCYARGDRLCWIDELMKFHVTYPTMRDMFGSAPIWFDGGEGNNNQEESGFYSSGGYMDDWSACGNGRGCTRLATACCRTIGWFD